MPNPSQALIAFGRLVSFFDDAGAGESAEVQFEWFADPLTGSLVAIPQNRARLHELFQALIHDDVTGQQPAFPLAGLSWEPINLGANIGVGFVWNPTGTPLQLGLGAAASFTVGGQDIDLAVLSRLVAIQGGTLDTEVPGVVFGGTIPVPDFLLSASLQGELPTPFSVQLTVGENQTSTRTLALPGPQLPWDSARLAVFILQAWVRDQSTGGDTFFDRINEHLFPMFGDPPGGPIAPFPLFGAASMGSAPAFDPWLDSVVSLEGDAEGALTFLWHLRALLTGNEDSSFLDGSIFFPLDAPPSPGTVSTLSDVSGTLSDTSPGVFVGIEHDVPNGGNPTLVLRFQSGQDHLTVPLAGNVAGSLTRPILADDPAALGGFPLPEWMSLAESNPTRLRVVEETLPGTGEFGGSLAVDLLLTTGQPVGYSIQLPTLPVIELEFPHGGGGPFPLGVSEEQAYGLVFGLIAGAASQTPAQEMVSALQGLIDATLHGQTPDVHGLLTAVLAAAGDPTGAELDLGGLMSVGLGADSTLELGLELAELGDALEGSAIHIGSLKLEADLALQEATEPLKKVMLRLDDLRIDAEQAGAPGVAGSLVGDLKEAPGFRLVVGWSAQDGVTVGGGARVAVEQVIGPLELSSLQFEADNDAISVGLDAAFAMGPVQVVPYQLGVRVPFTDDPPAPFLHGLGLSMDAGGIRLAGHFGEVNGDYVGAAVVSVVDFFELSAIGGYTRLADESESLFIFASLVAPLGGPPFLFVTGVAGGFGYNRQLPPPGPISENPFMRVIRGEIELGTSATGALQTLSEEFLPAPNQHWIAAGLQFISFGFIHGKLVVVVGFPNFSLRILGSAAFGISPVAYFEIELQASADAEQFLLIAGLSHNSYVIHPDIFSLHGQFGLATWHDGDHAGDFVFSIGGYHDAFPVPAHYPALERVGVTAVVYGFIRMSVTCYFATTPQAMMAGASVSLSAEFAGIAAGLDVYIDVYIQWDPFFIQGQMGVVVWFEFMGRHEIGVHLKIHTPPLGGVATIDLAIVSFDIEFGEKLAPTPRLRIHEFLESQLGVEADGWNGAGAQVAALSTQDRAGLFRLDMLWGRTATSDHTGDAQEGITAQAPIRVGSEFAFTVRTRLPVEGVTYLQAPVAAHSVSIPSLVDLPLCHDAEDLLSTLTVTGTRVGEADPTLLDAAFPSAQFGPEVTSFQPDSFAKSLIGSVQPEEATIDLTEGLRFTYLPELTPAGAEGWDLHAKEEPSVGESERYPLPLGPPPQPFVHRMPKAQLTLASSGGWTFRAPGRRRAAAATRRDLVRQRIEARSEEPLRLSARGAAVLRDSRLGGAHTRSSASVRTRMAPVAPPASPVRRVELKGVTLHRVAPRVPGTARPPEARRAGRVRPATLPSAQIGSMIGAAPARMMGAVDRSSPTLRLAVGHAIHLEIRSRRPAAGAFTIGPGQMVRAVFLGARGQAVADQYLSGGSHHHFPPRARQVVFFGEGVEAPVAPARPTRSGRTSPAMATEAVGVEMDSTLTALGARTFAAHGCVVEALSALPERMQPLDSLMGFDLLSHALGIQIHFPAVQAGGTLVILCEPAGGDPSPAAEDIRWRTVDAELGELQTVARADGVALTMPVAAEESWLLEVDLGRDWRLAGAAWRPQGQGDTVRWLASSSRWDMTDDRRVEPLRPVVTSIELEFEE